jgi:acyl carrier protein
MRVFEEVVRTTLDLRPADEIDPDESLSELGMDSLLAVELRNSLSAVFERRLSSTLLFDYPTLRMLARFIEREVFPAAREETVQAAAPAAVAVTANSEADPLSILDEIERLSEEEVEASFAKGSHR